MDKNKLEIVASIAALLILVVVCTLVIESIPLADSAKLASYLFLIPVTLFFIYEWHSERSLDRKDFFYGVLFGALWTIVGIVLVTYTYNVDIISFLLLKKDAWDKIGYIGVFLIGPLIVVFSILSIIRDTIILKYLKYLGSV